MFHIRNLCPVCKAGYVGFMRCSGEKDLVLFCDECDAVWVDPPSVDVSTVVFPSSGRFVREALCTLERWATREEIKFAGWEHLIAGEYERPHQF